MLLSLLAITAGETAMDRALAELAARDARVARVGYVLASRGAPLCATAGHPTGFALDRLLAYGPKSRAAAARRGLGIEPTVTTVVTGSPAAAAGIAPGDRLQAIEGGAKTYDDAEIERALADGHADFSFRRGAAVRSVSMTVSPGCRVRFLVRDERSPKGYSDGLTVQATSGLIDLAENDGQLAAPLAHELAHNILGFPAVLAAGQTASQVRAAETAADRLSIYLLDLAGYPFADALAFWDRYGPTTDHGIFSDRSHPNWRARIAAMTAEHDRIEMLRAQGRAVRPPTDLLP